MYSNGGRIRTEDVEKVPVDYYDLQPEWKNSADGSFAQFNGRKIGAVKFAAHFQLPRDDSFPVNDLFKKIDEEILSGGLVAMNSE